MWPIFCPIICLDFSVITLHFYYNVKKRRSRYLPSIAILFFIVIFPMHDVRRQRTYVVSFIQALDSFGKPGAGILAGNVNWLGHFDECTSLDGFQYCSIIFNVSLLQSVGSVSDYIFFSDRCTFSPTGAHFYRRHRGQIAPATYLIQDRQNNCCGPSVKLPKKVAK